MHRSCNRAPLRPRPRTYRSRLRGEAASPRALPAGARPSLATLAQLVAPASHSRAGLSSAKGAARTTCTSTVVAIVCLRLTGCDSLHAVRASAAVVWPSCFSGGGAVHPMGCDSTYAGWNDRDYALARVVTQCREVSSSMKAEYTLLASLYKKQAAMSGSNARSGHVGMGPKLSHATAAEAVCVLDASKTTDKKLAHAAVFYQRLLKSINNTAQ